MHNGMYILGYVGPCMLGKMSIFFYIKKNYGKSTNHFGVGPGLIGISYNEITITYLLQCLFVCQVVCLFCFLFVYVCMYVYGCFVRGLFTGCLFLCGVS